VTFQLADNPQLLTASRYWQVVLAKLKSLPLDVWRNGLIFLSILWLCHSAAGLFWVLYPVSAVPQPTTFAVPIDTGSASVSSTTVDILALQELKLFGDAGELPEVELEVEAQSSSDLIVDENAATTQLNLKLHGVIASDNQLEARAIIDTGKDQNLYRIGDEIKLNKGVKLAKVMEQRIILDNKGSHESLWLYSEEDFKKSASNRANRHKVTREGPGADRPKPTVNKSIQPSQIPKSISDVVRFSVHREEGKMVGYKLRPGRDKELFEQVGLKSGDIVTSVNGRIMNDPKQLRDVYQDLKTATEANLVVRRGESELPITIRVDNTGG